MLPRNCWPKHFLDALEGRFCSEQVLLRWVETDLGGLINEININFKCPFHKFIRVVLRKKLCQKPRISYIPFIQPARSVIWFPFLYSFLKLFRNSSFLMFSGIFSLILGPRKEIFSVYLYSDLTVLLEMFCCLKSQLISPLKLRYYAIFNF